jgi:hypothetical protein
VNNNVLTSTLILIILSSIGLVFFIRASVKARIQQLQLIAPAPETDLLSQLQTHLQSRAYRIAQVTPAENQITFEGFVQPSWLLAGLLTLLAVGGSLCMGLTLSLIFPSYGSNFFWLVVISPLAGIFYWQKAGRSEQISLKLKTSEIPEKPSIVTITAHRDELAEIKKVFNERLLPE